MEECKECEGLGFFDYEHLGSADCDACNRTGRADGRQPLDPLEGEDRDKAVATFAHCLREPWLHKSYLSDVVVEKEGSNVIFRVKRRNGFTYIFELTSVESTSQDIP